MSSGAAPLIAPEQPEGDNIRVQVLKVFDGDGFLARLQDARFNSGHEIAFRLGFIDAPEMEQPGGREARDFLHRLIGGKCIDVVPLIKMNTGGIVDRHGRVVCVAYLTERAPPEQLGTSMPQVPAHRFWAPRPVTRNIELEMILNGWAWVLNRYEPEKRYHEALLDAQSSRRGIWAYEDNVHPWEFKKQRYRSKLPSRNTAFECDLFATAEGNDPCPSVSCSGHLLDQIGRFGPFRGCSNFPRCRYTCSAAAQSERPRQDRHSA